MRQDAITRNSTINRLKGLLFDCDEKESAYLIDGIQSYEDRRFLFEKRSLGTGLAGKFSQKNGVTYFRAEKIGGY